MTAAEAWAGWVAMTAEERAAFCAMLANNGVVTAAEAFELLVPA